MTQSQIVEWIRAYCDTVVRAEVTRRRDGTGWRVAYRVSRMPWLSVTIPDALVAKYGFRTVLLSRLGHLVAPWKWDLE